MQPDTKRRAVAQQCAVVDVHASVLAFTQAMAPLDGEASYSCAWRRAVTGAELYKVANTLTAYGNICKETNVAGSAGSMSIFHVNPFAFLLRATEVSHEFRSLLQTAIASSPNGLDIVVYMDKATPGNELRPDQSRTRQCVYWTILQLPGWFRSRANGWLPFAYVSCKEQKATGVSDGALLKLMLQTFDDESSDVSFSQGFGVHGPAGSTLHVRRNRFLQVADWEQHVKSFNLKGYNGIVPCGICKNVVGRCPFFQGDAHLVHVQSSEYQRFDLHTPETFAEAVRFVSSKAGNRGELAQAEKLTGIKYDARGVLFDAATSQKLAFPNCQYPDWMHTLVASGGLAQYEVNGFVRKMVVAGISLADIDAWRATVTWPKDQRLSKTWFQDRYVDRPDAHIRAFASEVLAAVVQVHAFVGVVVRPMFAAHPDWQDSLDCFDLLVVILDLLRQGDRRRTSTLRAAIQSHHVLYLRLQYHRVAKLHLQAHIVDFWEYYGTLLSCFSTERKHRLFKNVGRYNRKSHNKTALAHDVRSWMKRLDDPNLYSAERLVQSRPWNYVLPWCGIAVTLAQKSGTFQSEIGYFRKGDLLRYSVDGADKLGLALGFASSDYAPLPFLVFLTPCEPSVAGWNLHTAIVHVVSTQRIRCAVPYSNGDGSITPFLRDA